MIRGPALVAALQPGRRPYGMRPEGPRAPRAPSPTGYDPRKEALYASLLGSGLSARGPMVSNWEGLGNVAKIIAGSIGGHRQERARQEEERRVEDAGRAELQQGHDDRAAITRALMPNLPAGVDHDMLARNPSMIGPLASSMEPPEDPLEQPFSQALYGPDGQLVPPGSISIREARELAQEDGYDLERPQQPEMGRYIDETGRAVTLPVPEAQGRSLMPVSEHQTNQRLARPSRAGVTVNMPGAGDGAIGLQRPVASAQQTSLLEAQGAVEEIEAVKGLYRPEYLTTSAAMQAKVSSLAERLGFKDLLPEELHTPEGFYAFKQRVSNTLATKLNALAGSAVSASEAERILATIPSMQDSPSDFEAKLEQYEAQMREVADRASRALTEGVQPWELGPLGASPAPPRAAADQPGSSAAAGGGRGMFRGAVDRVNEWMEGIQPPDVRGRMDDVRDAGRDWINRHVAPIGAAETERPPAALQEPAESPWGPDAGALVRVQYSDGSIDEVPVSQIQQIRRLDPGLQVAR